MVGGNEVRVVFQFKLQNDLFFSLSNVERSEAILFTNYRSKLCLTRAEEGWQLLGRLERIGLKTGGIGGMLGPQRYCPHAPIPNCFSDCHTTEA